MEMPFGSLDGKVLTMDFSSADFSVASVLAAVRMHLDMLEEMGVTFLGISTDVPAGPEPVFRPVPVRAIFEHSGKGDAGAVLERAYQIVWQGVVNSFPDESQWAAAKKDFAQFISAQADLLRARLASEQSLAPEEG
jgi:hypothetical protein